jgi:adenylate kinase
MIIIFFGPPGSGKGTQAQALASDFGYKQISTGNLLRQEIASGSALGEQLKESLGRGELISDETVIALFQKEFEKNLDQDIILDGIPRTVFQAEALSKMFEKHNVKLSHVFDLEIDDALLFERIVGRYSCKKCGAAYHKQFNPTKRDGICDYCESHDFVIRHDDTEEVLKKRLEVYYGDTLPVLNYYKDKDVLRLVDASKSFSEVNEQIKNYLK